MIIRPAKKIDLDALMVLLEEMVIYHAKIDRYYKSFREYSGLRAEAESWLSNKDMRVLVAEDNGGLIGYAQVSVEDAPTYAAVKKIGVVYDMFVLPPYRRKGIAEMLFNEAMDWFGSKKIKNIELSVDARNAAGVKYWESLGFFVYKLRMRLNLDKSASGGSPDSAWQNLRDKNN